MAWLYILLALFAILILVLLAPINLVIEYREQLKIKVKFMGITFSIPIPSGNTKKSKKNQTPTKKEKKKPKKDILKSIENIGKVLKFAKESIAYVTKKIKINTLKLILYIGTKDAAETAIKYGQASAVVYPTLSLVNALSKPRKVLVNIIPNFPSEKINVDFKICIKSSIFNLLLLAITLFKKYKEII